ncbi:MAG TPA: NAD-dependent epimerase/dehydratase family protein, partial [Gemmataceae bacterium]|nr:NAD-dependent epimerase/dehydratase family protein [Gemmataceae bacterium]
MSVVEPSPDFWARKRVCVTGGTGFLGYHIVQQLVTLGARVRVLALPPNPEHPLLKASNVEFMRGDVRDLAVVRGAVAACDVIFHTAGVVAVWGQALQRMNSVHVEGTRNVLAAAGSDARIVHTSSVVAVGASRDGDVLNEDSPFNLNGVRIDYVQAKRAAEQLAFAAAARGRHVIVTNPGYLLGPEDHEHSVMGRFCLRFWKGRMPVAPPGGLSLADVRDVARGHLLAAEHGRAGRRYILGGENRTFTQFMAELARVGGMSPRILLRLPWWSLRVLASLAAW